MAAKAQQRNPRNFAKIRTIIGNLFVQVQYTISTKGTEIICKKQTEFIKKCFYFYNLQQYTNNLQI